jgi:hypothetical protein
MMGKDKKRKPWFHEVYESADTVCERVSIKHNGKYVTVAWWTGCGIESCPSTTVFEDPKPLSDEELEDLYPAALKMAKKNRIKVLAGKDWLAGYVGRRHDRGR